MASQDEATREHPGPDTDRREAAEAYRGMLLIRSFEELCLELSRAGTIIGPIHLCGGQEAVPVGCNLAMRRGDRVVATYRGHGWAICAGIPLHSVLGEICHRANGINGGRAGSALLASPQHGFIGENAIVGAGVPIATGAALAAGYQGTDRVVVVSIGDGAMNQGATCEGLAFAAAQRLPVVIVCEYNEWAEMTPTATVIPSREVTSRAAGFGIPSVTVDGCDPLAVRDVALEAMARARAGEGPSFLECRTVRLMAHYNGDVEHYRDRASRAADRERDPLPRMRTRLIESGACTGEQLEELETVVSDEVQTAAQRVAAMAHPDPTTVHEHVVSTGNRRPHAPPANSETREMTYAQSVGHALREELRSRPEMLVYGEDVGVAGGVFGITRELQKEFGDSRVFDSPISESAILGSALGAAIEGLRPVVEIMWSDFLLVALDQLINQAANVRYLTRGSQTAPMVVRTQQGVTPGSCMQHAQSLEALLAHIPGLKVGMPSTPHDAYSMLRAAIDDPDPCVIIESRALYGTRGDVRIGDELEDVGGATVRREGGDVAIIAWGVVATEALQAANRLAEQGIDAAVIDLRWLRPLDRDAIGAAVEMGSGRVLVAHEANITCGVGAEVAACIVEGHFHRLQAPVVRVGMPDVRIPAAPELQDALMPDASRIVAAAKRMLGVS